MFPGLLYVSHVWHHVHAELNFSVCSSWRAVVFKVGGGPLLFASLLPAPRFLPVARVWSRRSLGADGSLVQKWDQRFLPGI